MWTSVILFVFHILIVRIGTNAIPNQIFTENGRAVVEPLEEDIGEQLVPVGGAEDTENWNDRVPTDDDKPSNLIPKEDKIESQGQSKNEQVQQPQFPVKREGQEEFATFVDSNRLLSKQSYQGGDIIEKRAKVDSSTGSDGDLGDTVFIAVTTVCTAAAVFGLIAAAFIWRRVHLRNQAAQESEYPHYGITGPTKERSGGSSPVAVMDAKLASSAQLYHYQHTKQQIIAMEHSTCESKGQDSDESEVEEDEGDFSVYEYPGLAPTGDMEVANPLFENVASPQTKTDPNASQLEPRIHHRF